MLPPGNFEVLEANDGLEGLNLIRQEHPSLIMLDFLLPKLSGWEVFQQIQNHPDLQKIPLLVMSGRKEEVIEKIPEPFEYFEFILKPFEQEELIGAIKSAMTKARLPRKEAVVRDTPQILDGASLTNVNATVMQPAAVVEASSSVMGAGATEIQILNQKIAKMQAEIDGLKQQLAQVVTFIKKGMRS